MVCISVHMITDKFELFTQLFQNTMLLFHCYRRLFWGRKCSERSRFPIPYLV